MLIRGYWLFRDLNLGIESNVSVALAVANDVFDRGFFSAFGVYL